MMDIRMREIINLETLMGFENKNGRKVMFMKGVSKMDIEKVMESIHGHLVKLMKEIGKKEKSMERVLVKKITDY